MAYIKFHISTRHTDDKGYPMRCTIRRVASDMNDTEMLETNILMNALSVRGIVELSPDNPVAPEPDNNGFPYTFPITFR